MTDLLSFIGLIAVTFPFWRTVYEWHLERQRPYQPRFTDYQFARQEIDQLLSHAEAQIRSWDV